MIKKIKNLYHYILALLGKIIYDNPSRKITVIGVTGTKGKTSTVALITTALSACGHKVAMISSVYIAIGDKKRLNTTENTMLGRGKAQKVLAEAVKAGCKFMVMEVSSLGVKQHRHKFIEWDAGVFMNIHPEHIEAHGSFENYRSRKADFFRYAAKSPKKQKAFFINKEDESASYFADAAGENKKVFFSGSFFKANYAAAAAVTEHFGCDRKVVEKALENFSGVPGRLETVIQEPFKVVVDYAHTAESLEQVYKWVMLPSKISHGNHKLICVLGSAGGGRDKWKRPKMGAVAAKYCDELIITNEDPYDEDPMEIMEQLAEGAKGTDKNAIMILDRQEAIDKAVSLAKDGDTVIITGKGSERYIHFAKGKKLAWSDKEAVKRAMRDKNKI